MTDHQVIDIVEEMNDIFQNLDIDLNIKEWRLEGHIAPHGHVNAELLVNKVSTRKIVIDLERDNTFEDLIREIGFIKAELDRIENIKVVSPIEFLLNLDIAFGYRNMGNVYVDDFNDLHQLDYLNSGYNTNVGYWIKSITINFNFVYLPKD